MEHSDLVDLLDRAVLAHQTRVDPESAVGKKLVADLSAAATQCALTPGLCSLLLRAIEGVGSTCTPSEDDARTLVDDLLALRNFHEVGRNDADEQLFAAMHRYKGRFTVERVGAAFANLPRRQIEGSE